MRPIVLTDRAVSTAEEAGEDESALITRCREGDTRAFGVLVTRYQDRVYNLCLRMCSRVEDAEDYAQEAFVKAFGSLAQFDGRSRFYTWLFRIAVNLVLSGRRRTMRVRMHSLDTGGGSDGNADADFGMSCRLEMPGAGPAADADARERHALVMAALETLDEEQRAIIVLRDIEAMDYSEIAEVLAIAPGTVKSRLHRARMALREELGPVLDTE